MSKTEVIVLECKPCPPNSILARMYREESEMLGRDAGEFWQEIDDFFASVARLEIDRDMKRIDAATIQKPSPTTTEGGK